MVGQDTKITTKSASVVVKIGINIDAAMLCCRKDPLQNMGKPQ